MKKILFTSLAVLGLGTRKPTRYHPNQKTNFCNVPWRKNELQEDST